DEVMTGFRVAFGGAQQRFGISPDLTTLGKIVGGGLPLAAYGGRRDLMRHVMPAGRVCQAGTLSGNPIATAAGLAMLKLLQKDPPYDRLEQRSRELADGFLAAAREAGIPASVARVGSMLTLFFCPEVPHDWETASHADVARFARYFWGMLQRGVYLPCSQFEAMFVSTAHTHEHVQSTLAAAREALRDVA
ncbi:MAG TPA: aminotransferase class III-fold pyridoxal phosphate-dependent enzyme, partial [Pirellulaceae bacterium]